METLTEDVLAELEGKAKAATPGPWRTGHHQPNPDGEYSQDIRTCDVGRLITDCGIGANEYDATFIAAANPAAVLALIAEVRRLKTKVAEADTRTAEVEAAAREWAKAESEEEIVRLKSALEASEEARTQAEKAVREAQEAGRAEWQQAMAVAGEIAAQAAMDAKSWRDRAGTSTPEGRDAYTRAAAQWDMLARVADDITATASPPITPAGRLTLVGHHLRAAKALCEAVATSADVDGIRADYVVPVIRDAIDALDKSAKWDEG